MHTGQTSWFPGPGLSRKITFDPGLPQGICKRNLRVYPVGQQKFLVFLRQCALLPAYRAASPESCKYFVYDDFLALLSTSRRSYVSYHVMFSEFPHSKTCKNCADGLHYSGMGILLCAVSFNPGISFDKKSRAGFCVAGQGK